VFLESHNGKITPFKSLAKISNTIPSRQGIENAVLRPHVMEFVGKKMKLLEAAGNSWHLGLPVAVGLRGKTTKTPGAVKAPRPDWLTGCSTGAPISPATKARSTASTSVRPGRP
jgi:hypothetical protein